MPATLLLVILLATLVAFVLEWFPLEVTALACLAALLVCDLVTPAEAVAGFGNPAVITVMMMFVISEALVKSGLVAAIGRRIAHTAGGEPRRALLLLLGTSGSLSAFVNNTAAVSILIPVTLQLAKHYRQAASRLLIPLSYAAILGGTCTLIGTSTNLLVHGLAVEHGQEGFGVFEFLPLGLVSALLGTVYLIFLAPRFLPAHEPPDSLTHKYHLGGFLTELRVAPGSPLVGKTVVSEQVSERFQLNVLEILRGKEKIAVDIRHTVIAPEDVLLVRGGPRDLVDFRDHYRLLMLTDTKMEDQDLADERNVLAEVQISPMAEFVGRSVKQLDFRRRFGAFVLAVNRTGEAIRDKVAFIPLKAWDTLLVFGPRARVEALHAHPGFLPLQELEIPLRPPKRSWIAPVLAAAAVAVAALGWVSILEAVLVAAVLLLVGNILPIQRAYKAVDWSVIFLIAALFPLAQAMERTGLADRVAALLLSAADWLGPVGMVGLIYLTTAILSEMVSNNATAILLVPVAIQTAAGLGVEPRPFLFAVAFAASSSFLTPMGYQTNAMVYGPGGYRFVDYLRAGWPLKVTLWVVATLLIPRLWPLQPAG